PVDRISNTNNSYTGAGPNWRGDPETGAVTSARPERNIYGANTSGDSQFGRRGGSVEDGAAAQHLGAGASSLSSYNSINQRRTNAASEQEAIRGGSQDPRSQTAQMLRDTNPYGSQIRLR
ncbi:unnamed protein product, partial [Amoebophrya sp. A25]